MSPMMLSARCWVTAGHVRVVHVGGCEADASSNMLSRLWPQAKFGFSRWTPGFRPQLDRSAAAAATAADRPRLRVGAVPAGGRPAAAGSTF